MFPPPPETFDEEFAATVRGQYASVAGDGVTQVLIYTRVE